MVKEFGLFACGLFFLRFAVYSFLLAATYAYS